MNRINRMLVFTIIIFVLANITASFSKHAHAPLLTEFILLSGHARFFTFAIVASGVLTGELGILVCVLFGEIVLVYPTDPLPMAYAVFFGGIIGGVLRRLIIQHEPVRESSPNRPADRGTNALH